MAYWVKDFRRWRYQNSTNKSKLKYYFLVKNFQFKRINKDRVLQRFIFFYIFLYFICGPQFELPDVNSIRGFHFFLWNFLSSTASRILSKFWNWAMGTTACYMEIKFYWILSVMVHTCRRYGCLRLTLRTIQLPFKNIVSILLA